MDVDPAAGAVRIEDRREDRAVPEAERRGARHLAQLHGVVGRLHPERGRDRSPRTGASPYSGRKVSGSTPARAHRRHQHFAEDALPPLGIEAVGRARQLLDAGIDELVLEGRRRAAGRPPPSSAVRRAAQEIRAGSTPRACRRCGGCRRETSARRRRRRRSRRSPRSPDPARGSGRRSRRTGVSAIGPSAEIMVLVGTQPTPFTSREASSPAGNPLPRTRPAISQVQTMMSFSRCIGGYRADGAPSLPISGRRRSRAQGALPS